MAVASLDGWTLISTAIAAGGNAFPVSAGSNRLIVVKVANVGLTAQDITSVSYGGQSLTEIQSADTTDNRDCHSSLWYLDEAGIAAASDDDFDWSPTTGSVSFRMFAASYSGVDQTSPITDSDVTTATSGADPTTPSLTTVADGFVVATFTHNRGTEETPDPDITWGNVTEQTENIATQIYNNIAHEAATTTSLDPNLTSTTLYQVSHYIAASLEPAAGIDVDGDVDGFLPTVASEISVGTTIDSDVDGFLPTVASQLDVIVELDGAALGFLPTVASQLDVIVELDGAALGFLPTVASQLDVTVEIDASIAGFLPTVSADITVPFEDFIDDHGHGVDQRAIRMMEMNLRAIEAEEDELEQIMPAILGTLVNLRR